MPQKLAILTAPKFYAWLQTKSPRTVVGYRGAYSNCPIARYIKQTIGVFNGMEDYLHIGTKHIAIPVSEFVNKQYELPKWATKFVHEIDKEPPQAYRAKSSISRVKAEKVLKQVAPHSFR